MNSSSLRGLLDGPYADVRDMVREWLSRPGTAAASQEHGRLGAARSKAVIKAVNALCAGLRPDVGMLVEVFGVPEPALADARRVAAVTP
jgi:hypothetical protein